MLDDDDGSVLTGGGLTDRTEGVEGSIADGSRNRRVSGGLSGFLRSEFM